MIIRHLFISPGHNYRGHHGGPPGDHAIAEVPRVECVAGRGLCGDRYFDFKPDYKGQITFFEWGNLLRMWDELGLQAELRDPAATRRNVILDGEGIDLNSLIGVEFEIQGVRFLGTEECKPCYWMNGAIHPEAEDWMKGRGGLRAEILRDGFLRLGAVDALASVLLAGGQSTRMGRDKALLEVGGQPLWSRQIATLRALGNPVSVAAPTQPDWLPADTVWVRDADGVRGPLAGLITALEWTKAQNCTHLAALAVDVPKIDANTLGKLLLRCRPGFGVVPQRGEHYEPLVAIYPIEALPPLHAAAAACRWKLQDAIAELVEAGLLLPETVQDASLFFNLNSPEDLPEEPA